MCFAPGLFQKDKERHQRAVHKKKQSPVTSSGESVRTSPRVQRHSRSSQSDTPEKSASEPLAETGAGSSQSTPSSGDLQKEQKPPLGDLSLSTTQKSDDKEESAMDVVLSDSEADAPARSPGGAAKPSRSDPDLGSRGSQVKAAEMSEVGIFERFSLGCASASEKGDRPAAEREDNADKPKALCSSQDGEARCSTEKDRDADCSTKKDRDAGCATEKDKDAGCSTEKDDDAGCSTEKDSDAGCSTEKDSDAGCSTEKDDDAGCSTEKDRDADCSTEKDRDADCSTENEESDAKCPTPRDSSAHDADAARRSSSVSSQSAAPAADSTHPALQAPISAVASQTTRASAGSSDVSDDLLKKTPPVSSSTIRSPPSVSRNLFETFLAVSRDDDDDDDKSRDEVERQQQPVVETPGETGDVQTGDCGEGKLGDGRNARRSRAGESLGSEAAELAGEEVAPKASESADSSRGNGSASAPGGGATGDGSASGDNAPPAPGSSGDSAAVKADNDDAAPAAFSNAPSSRRGSTPLGSASSADRSAADGRDGAPPGRAVALRSAGKHATICMDAVREDGGSDSRAVVPRYERPLPRDFNTIKMKLEADKYTSVVSQGHGQGQCQGRGDICLTCVVSCTIINSHF